MEMRGKAAMLVAYIVFTGVALAQSSPAAPTAPAAAPASATEASPACRAATQAFFDHALRYKEALTLGQLERSQPAWAVRRECGDLPGLLSNAVSAARVPPQSAAPRGETQDDWVVPLLFFGLLVHQVTR